MTLEDVAKRARVSTATVSRVLNGAREVRPATRARVMRAVEELNYTPDLNARSLAGGQPRLLGMVVSNIANPFFLDIFRSVESCARQRGYDLIVANTDYDPERLASSIMTILGRRVGGLALVVSETVPPVVSTIAGALPVVLYDGGAHRLKNATNIRANYRGGMQRIVEYLHALGHRRMAFLGHHTRLGPLHERRQAFVSIAEEYAAQVKVMAVANADGLAGGQQAMRQVLDSGFRPTAVACVNDLMAVGAMRELHVRGMSVPGDVSVTGFDNIGLAEFATPALTTADVPRETIGRLLFDALVPPAGGDRALSRAEVVVETELIVRESTARPHQRGRASARPERRTARASR
ncbi:MAG TPA: LacI family DNA-binding transcriptional regulator [Gemmatimonadaceae bacterium]|nr:LacI family DNA-binding transcriptional regulator [Gemmatimonadaceae bacterium]